MTKVLVPAAEKLAPPDSPGRLRRAGSWVEAIPARSTTRHNPAAVGMCSKRQAQDPMLNIGRAKGVPLWMQTVGADACIVSSCVFVSTHVIQVHAHGLKVVGHAAISSLCRSMPLDNDIMQFTD
jgi:hypothetical protein